MKTTILPEPSSTSGKRNGFHVIKRAPRMPRALNGESESLVGLSGLVRSLLGTGRGPSVTFVYQDDQTHTWAKAVSQKIAKLTGEEGVRETWWKVGDLDAPGILAGAVSSALRADLIIVATHGEGMPLPFYVWINLWWPHREEVSGGLVALVGAPQPAAAQAGRVGDYLREVAQQARMEYFSAEKLLRCETQNLNGKAHTSLNGVNGSHRSGFERRTNSHG